MATSQIKAEGYYRTGETIVPSTYSLALPGFVNTGRNVIYVYFYLDKKAPSNEVTINSFSGSLAGVGGQILGYTDFTSSPYSVVGLTIGGARNVIRFAIETTGTFNTTAYSTAMFFVQNLSFTF